MKSLYFRIASGVAAVSLLAGAAGIATLAQNASAATGGPTTLLTSPVTSSSTNLSTIPVTATFSEPVTGFGTSSIDATNATVSNFVGTTTTYTFDLHPAAQGAFSVLIPADQATGSVSGQGNQQSNTLSWTYNTSAPTISNVMATSTTATTSTITWTTNEPANSQVNYGTTASYGASTTDATLVTSHSVMLSGLSPSTMYHYQVQSTDAAGNSATSSDNTFTTSASSTTTPLALTSIDAVKTDGIADNTFVHGWEWVMHLTVPDNENALRMSLTDFTMGTTSSSSIPANGNIRIFSLQSSNSTDESSATYLTGSGVYSNWLYLTGDTSTTTAGRQIDLTIEVRIPVGTPNGSYSSNYAIQSVPESATSTTP